MVRSFALVPPVVWLAVLGSSVMFSGTMRASNAGIGIGAALGRVGELAAVGCALATM